MSQKIGARVSPDYWQSWIWDSATSDKIYRLVQRYQRRPAETLYHTATDPYEMQDLLITQSQDTSRIRDELSSELDRWMESQGDPGIEQDTRQTHQAAKRGNHRFRAPAKPH